MPQSRNEQDKLAQLRKIKSYYFHPFATRRDIERLLQEKGVGAAHPIGNNELLLWDGKSFETISIAGIDPKHFLSAVSFDEAQSNTVSYMNRYPELTKIKDYEVQIGQPGDSGELPFDGNDAKLVSFVATTKCNDDFFDLVSYFVKNDKVDGHVDYLHKNQSYKKIKHSGDIGSLLHTLIMEKFLDNSTSMVLAVTGFRKKHLHTFTNQLPIVHLINHKTKTVHVVPLSLDQASTGEATLAGLLVLKREGDTLRYHILRQPVCVNNVDTGDCSEPTETQILSAVKQAMPYFVSAPPVRTAAASTSALPPAPQLKAPVTDHKTIDNPLLKELMRRPIVIYKETGLKCTLPTSKEITYVDVGTGMNFSLTPPTKIAEAPVMLPTIFGPCRHTAALALGNPNDIMSEEGYSQWQTSRQLIIVHVTPNKVSDPVKKSCTTAGNAVFILHSTDKTVNENNPAALKAHMNQLSRNAFVMAGPNAILLVEMPSGNRYWYRGVTSWPGLLSQQRPTYGEKVDLSDAKLMRWARTNGGMQQLPYTNLHPFDNQDVFFQGQMQQYGKAINYISGMDKGQITAHAEDILNVLTQISSFISPEALQSLYPTLRAISDKIRLPLEGSILNELVLAIQRIAPEREVSSMAASWDRTMRREDLYGLQHHPYQVTPPTAYVNPLAATVSAYNVPNAPPITVTPLWRTHLMNKLKKIAQAAGCTL